MSVFYDASKAPVVGNSYYYSSGPGAWGPTTPGTGLGVGQYSDNYQALYGGRSPDSAVKNYAAALPKVIDNKNAEKLRPILVGQSNQKGNWQNVPLLLGTMTWYPLETANFVALNKGSGWQANVGYDVCYGPISLDINKLKIGDKTITQVMNESQDADGDDAYQIFADGAAASAYTLYPGDYETLQVNVAMPRSTQLVRTTPQECDSFIVNVQFDNGLYKFVNVTLTDGSVVQDRQASTVNIKLEYRKVGTATWYTTGSTNPWVITGEVANTYAVSKQVKKSNLESNYGVGNARGIYEVRCTRQTAVGNNLTNFDQTTWLSVVAIKNDAPYKPIYDAGGAEVPIVRLILKLFATEDLQGTLQQVSITAQSKVPIWNGTTWSAPTASSNPADLFLWVCKGPFNSRPYTDAELDLAAFLEWRNWCITKGFTFDAIIDQPMALADLLNAIAAAGRAKWVRRDGKLSVSVDKEQTTVAHHFTVWNVIAGSFTFSVPQVKKLHGLKVNWLDPSDQYQQAQRRVFNDGYSDSNASLFEVVDLFGCANADMAYKYGRYLLAVMELRSKLYELSVCWEYLLCSVGSLVRLNHDVAMFGLGSGFVRSVVTNGGGDITHIKIDNPVAISDGAKSYSLRFLLSDGTEMLRPVVNPGVGDWDQLQLVTPIPAATSVKPARHTQYLYGEYTALTQTANDSRLMIVIAIEPLDDDCARVVLQEYNAAIYTADSVAIPDYVSNNQRPASAQYIPAMPTVTSVKSDESVLKPLGNNVFINQIVMTLGQQPNIKEFELQYKNNAAPVEAWSAKMAIPSSTGAITLSGFADGEPIDIQVRAISKWGVPGPYNIFTHTVVGKTTVPPDLTRLLNDSDGKLRPEMVNRPLDIVFVQYRLNWGNNQNWNQASILATVPFNSPFDLRAIGFAAGLKTVLAKAVDVTGRMSVNALWIKTDYGENLFQPLISEQAIDPAFMGEKVNCTVDSGDLKQELTTEMWEVGDTHEFMWLTTEAPTELMWQDIYSEMTFEPTPYVVASTVPTGSVIRLIMGTQAALDVSRVEYKFVESSLMWLVGDDYELMWSTDEPENEIMWDYDWQPFPSLGVPAIAGARYAFKLTGFAGTTQRVWDAIKYRIDINEVTQYRNDVVIPSGGAWVAPPVPFKATLAAASVILQEDLVTYPNADKWVIDTTQPGYPTGKDKTLGVRVKILKADNTASGGVADVVMYGY